MEEMLEYENQDSGEKVKKTLQFLGKTTKRQPDPNQNNRPREDLAVDQLSSRTKESQAKLSNRVITEDGSKVSGEISEPPHKVARKIVEDTQELSKATATVKTNARRSTRSAPRSSSVSSNIQGEEVGKPLAERPTPSELYKKMKKKKSSRVL